MATRMSAVMALGLLGLTSFGATMVVGVNAGLQEGLAQNIENLNAEPDGRATMTFVAARSKDNANLTRRWAGMKSQISQDVAQQGGESLAYQMLWMTFIPKDNVARVQQLWLDAREMGAKSEDSIAVAKTRKERIEIRRAQRAVDLARRQRVERLGTLVGRACWVREYAPSGVDAWVVERKGSLSAMHALLGQRYAGIVNDNEAGLLAPMFTGVTLTRRIEDAPNIPRECDFLLSSTTQARLASRVTLNHKLVWWGTANLSERLAQWAIVNGKNESDKEDLDPWHGASVAAGSTLWKDYQTEDVIAKEQLLALIQKIAWSVIGVLALISAYQMCSLLILLGVHFNFEIAMVRSMGFGRGDIMGVFLLASLVFAVSATTLGAVTGISVVAAYNQWFGLVAQRMDFPMVLISIPGPTFWLILSGAWALGLLAGLFPAWLAAKADPAVIWRDA
jgi:hypothetical protein